MPVDETGILYKIRSPKYRMTEEIQKKKKTKKDEEEEEDIAVV